MHFPSLVSVLFPLSLLAAVSADIVANDDYNSSGLKLNGITADVREKYMRLVNEKLYEQAGSVCPFASFGAMIVNHTADEVVCVGANDRTGDPTLHGEISAIQACTKVFVDKNMTSTEIYAAWGELSLYTNAESCPMCASAIRWAGFKEYVYGTTIKHNYEAGWGVMTLSSWDVFQYSRILPGAQTLAIGQILINETDPLFAWQYNDSAPCPNGCVREASVTRGGTICTEPTNSTSSKREVVFGSGVRDHSQACEMGGYAGSHIGHDHGL